MQGDGFFRAPRAIVVGAHLYRMFAAVVTILLIASSPAFGQVFTPVAATVRPMPVGLTFAASRRDSMIAVDFAQTFAASTGTSTPVLRSEAPSNDALRLSSIQPRAKAPLRAPWWAPIASAIVPGSGQAFLGQQRSVVYAAAEAYLVVQVIAKQRDGNRDRQRFRDLALSVARRSFSGSKPTGTGAYYENMEAFLESGVYSRASGGPVVPESDTLTYNGSRWLLARSNNWRDPNVPPPATSPEYIRALNAYIAEAVTDEYRWSWRDAQLEWDVFRQTVRLSNNGYQRATNVLGLLEANHLFSLIDAYISVRVRRFGGAGIAGISFDGTKTEIAAIGDPANGQRQLRAGLRFVTR